jgi:hypothetical protein
MSSDQNVPTAYEGGDDSSLIKGTIVKCNDGVWSDRDGQPLPETLIAMATTKALQLWKGQKPVQTIKLADGPLPDVDALNAAIPKEEWEPGLDKQPRAPWTKQYVCYLVDPGDGSTYTYLNSTTGCRICIQHLEDRIKMMRALRGANVVPVVRLDKKPMKTEWGSKFRPELTVDGWVSLGGGGDAPLIEHRPSGGGGAAVTPEVLSPAKQQAAESAFAPKELPSLKTVKPATLSEELNDSVPL